MINDVTTEKLNMWKEKLKELEKNLIVAMHRKGEAAAMGDLSENAAYEESIRNVEMLQVKINEVKKIISKLQNGGK